MITGTNHSCMYEINRVSHDDAEAEVVAGKTRHRRRTDPASSRDLFVTASFTRTGKKLEERSVW